MEETAKGGALTDSELNIKYGRLQEAVHVTKYEMERACTALEELITDDAWQSVGPGYDDIKDFLEGVDLSDVDIIPSRRKAIAERLAEIGASQRATAKALGVGQTTIARDLGFTDSPESRSEADQAQVTPESDSSESCAEPDLSEIEPTEPGPPEMDSDELEEEPSPTKASSARLDSDGNPENYTPAWLIKAVRRVVPSIDLDPASCDFANAVVGAERFFNKMENGLIQEWFGNVFLNPPYDHPLIAQFAETVLSQRGNYLSCIVLTNASIGSEWWSELASHADAMCLLTKRVRFYIEVNGAAVERAAPPMGQSVLYFGDDAGKFRYVFSEFGPTWSSSNGN